MGRTSVMTSFHKFGMQAKWFETGQTGNPSTWTNLKPRPFGPGYVFHSICNQAAYVGSFAPQQILRPSKDSVDLIFKMWTLEPTYTTPGQKSGWCLGMVNLYGDDEKSNIAMLALSGGGGLLDNDLASVDPQVAHVNSDGNITWSIIGGMAEYPFPTMQFAMAYPLLHAQLPSGGMVSDMSLMRTDFRLIKQKDGVFYTDPSRSLTRFYDPDEGIIQGVMFNLWRMRAGGGGAIVDGAADWDGDGLLDYDTAPETGPVEYPIFLGMELEFL